jgi:hypothetical protein
MDENCQTFTKTFIEIIKKCVPQKEVTIRLNDKVWYSRTLQLSDTKTGSSKDWRVLHVLVGSVIMFFRSFNLIISNNL